MGNSYKMEEYMMTLAPHLFCAEYAHPVVRDRYYKHATRENRVKQVIKLVAAYNRRLKKLEKKRKT